MGRSREIAAIVRHASSRTPLVVVGEAGIGKTTLLRAAAEAMNRPYFEGGALSTLSWVDYLPIERAIGHAVRGGDNPAVAAAIEEEIGDAVLVIDDLQWADFSTLEVAGSLARRSCLLTALRLDDPAAPQVLDRLAAAGFATLNVEALPHADAMRIVRERNPGMSSERVDTVVRAAAGNPFLLEELAASDDAPTLRLALRARLRPHAAEVREGIALLGLLGRPAAPELLGSGATALLDLRLAVRRGDAIALRHALLGEVALQDLTFERLRGLHSRLARAVPEPGEAARHHEAAGELEAAVSKGLQAAELARTPGERARHLGVAAACSSGEEADRLRLDAAALLVATGDYRLAAELARASSPTTTTGRAEASLWAGMAVGLGGEWLEGLHLIEDGLASVRGTGTPMELRLLLALVRLQSYEAEAEAMLELAGGAASLSRRLGLYRAEATAGLALAYSQNASPRTVPTARSAARLAMQEGDPEIEFQARFTLAASLQLEGRPDAARRAVHECINRARELDLRGQELMGELHLAVVDFYASEEPGAAIERLERVRRRGIFPLQEGTMRRCLALALADAGRLEEAREALGPGPAHPERWAFFDYFHALSEVELAAGRPAEALEAARACLRWPHPYFSAAANLTAAWASFELGTTWSGRIDGPMFPMVAGAPLEMNAIASLSRGTADAELEFEDAGRAWAAAGHRGELRCQWAAGEACRRSGRPERARERLLEVEQRAEAAGSVTVLRRARRSLRMMGIHRSHTGEPPAGTITGRQREILELVGSGLTSRDIARRLGLSPGTVDDHVKAAMARLGARTRLEAAAAAARAASARD